jgi:hypothetical protein
LNDGWIGASGALGDDLAVVGDFYAAGGLRERCLRQQADDFSPSLEGAGYMFHPNVY